MQFEQRNSQASDYDIKTASGTIVGYNELLFQSSVKEQNKDKVEKFKQRLEEFKNVSTLDAAKTLAVRVMPVQSGRTVFQIGDAKCIVINTDKMLKITLKSNKEYINFKFV